MGALWSSPSPVPPPSPPPPSPSLLPSPFACGVVPALRLQDHRHPRCRRPRPRPRHCRWSRSRRLCARSIVPSLRLHPLMPADPSPRCRRPACHRHHTLAAAALSDRRSSILRCQMIFTPGLSCAAGLATLQLAVVPQPVRPGHIAKTRPFTGKDRRHARRQQVRAWCPAGARINTPSAITTL